MDVTSQKSDRTYGLFLNMGANLAPTTKGVFDLTVREAVAAEELGYAELWVTEHHFIDFGINPSAFTAAGFLLGRTERIRVGTAVTLSPLLHPVEMAERAALLDQLSGGRFSLGLGRGGYRKDYDVLGIDFARWGEEPMSSAQQILEHWGPDSFLRPAPLTDPHPELLLGTTGAAGMELAARNGLALQHYFAMPAEPRVQVEQAYQSFDPVGDPRHLHTLIVVVDDDPDIRDRLERAALQSFEDGDHPHVPQAPEFHVGPDGKPLTTEDQVKMAAQAAIVGPVGQVVDELGAFIETTGARRLAFFAEATTDADLTMRTITALAEKVIPQL